MMKQQTGRSAREMDRGRAAILAFVQSGEIRPEDIALTPDAGGASGTVGEIASRTYLGEIGRAHV